MPATPRLGIRCSSRPSSFCRRRRLSSSWAPVEAATRGSAVMPILRVATCPAFSKRGQQLDRPETFVLAGASQVVCLTAMMYNSTFAVCSGSYYRFRDANAIAALPRAARRAGADVGWGPIRVIMNWEASAKASPRFRQGGPGRGGDRERRRAEIRLPGRGPHFESGFKIGFPKSAPWRAKAAWD